LCARLRLDGERDLGWPELSAQNRRVPGDETVTLGAVPQTANADRIKLATLEDPVEIKSPASTGEYNESVNCKVKDELVSQLIALNNKLNLLSPDLVHGDEDRAEVQQQRENLYAEIKHHRAKGHEGKPCPAARQV
jgi:hypothetical protein